MIALVSTSAMAQGSIVVNGDFAEWKGNTPNGWEVEVGARNGADQPLSDVRKIAGPALMLRGNASTMAWNSVSQEVNLDPGATYQLEFDARCKDVRREGTQHDNCYVGLMSFDRLEKLAGHAIEDVSTSTGDWKHFSVDYTVPTNAQKTSVMIFLSKSGILGVKGVKITSGAIGAAREKDNLLSNASFKDWKGDLPESWLVEIGAKNGADQPLSKLAKIEDGVSLSGNARTLAWRSLSQDVEVRPRKTYALEFEAMVEGIRRESRQYDNCYVGVMSFDARGQRVDMAMEDLSQLRRWTKKKVTFTAPPTAKKTSVLIFLSKSGSLKIKNMQLGEAVPGRPFR